MNYQIDQVIKLGNASICGTCLHRAVCRAIENQPCVECSQYVPAPTTTTKLKHCPYCGKGAFEMYQGESYRICCENPDCPAEPRTHWYFNLQEARDAWNRRSSDADD